MSHGRLRFLLATALLAVAPAASAQGFGGPGMGGGFGPGMGGPGMGGGAPPPSGQPAKPKDGPETHAAAGAESNIPEGTEPELPENPLLLTDAMKRRFRPSLDESALDTGRDGQRDVNWYGPYYDETDGKYRLRLAFPVWLERTMPSRTRPSVVDRASLYGLYYNQRSAERADDILFPLFWNLRDLEHDSRTTVVGPLVNRVAKDETDNWVAPLYFSGTRKWGGYTVVPPLLHGSWVDATGGFSLFGPGFCSWSGGSSCDARTAHRIDLGVAPFYFFGQTERYKYESIPPLLHYYKWDDKDTSWVDIWGPYYREHTPEHELFHLLPFYWSITGKDERHTTVLPFFHHGYKGNSWLHVNPLFLAARGDKGESTFVSWLYGRFRGRTELDMWTPFYWQYRDPDSGIDQQLLAPFYFRRTSPREDYFALFPFYGRFKREALSDTTFVTPFVQHTTTQRGWASALHPVLYFGRSGYDSHLVAAPFFWDFASRTGRATVGFPFYWRFSDESYVAQLVGNVYYREDKRNDGTDWEIHLFPFFTYGQTPYGHWWNFLYGLAGFSRDGQRTVARAFYVPITLSDRADKKPPRERLLQPRKKRRPY